MGALFSALKGFIASKAAKAVADRNNPVTSETDSTQDMLEKLKAEWQAIHDSNNAAGKQQAMAAIEDAMNDIITNKEQEEQAANVKPMEDTLSPGQLKDISNLDKLKEAEAAVGETTFPDTKEAWADYWAAANGNVSEDELEDPKQENTPKEEQEEADEKLEQAEDTGKQEDVEEAIEEQEEADATSNPAPPNPAPPNPAPPNPAPPNPAPPNPAPPNPAPPNPAPPNPAPPNPAPVPQINRDDIAARLNDQLNKIARRRAWGNVGATVLSGVDKLISTNPMTGQSQGPTMLTPVVSGIREGTSMESARRAGQAGQEYTTGEQKVLADELAALRKRLLAAYPNDPKRAEAQFNRMYIQMLRESNASVRNILRTLYPMMHPLANPESRRLT